VLAHANHRTLPDVFDQVVLLLAQRQLVTRTLDDVFGPGVSYRAR
jgi:hypothetical protein